VVVLCSVGQVDALVVSLMPKDRVPPIVLVSLHDLVLPESVVGDNFIGFAVDFSFGGVEAIISEPLGLRFLGVNSNGQADFREPVDGRIVQPGTLSQGLTSNLIVQVETRINTLIEVFDVDGNLLESAIGAVSSNNNWQHTIDRPTSDIASFRISQGINSNFGLEVSRIFLEEPIAAPIPEPTTLLLLMIGLSAVSIRRARRRA
jgi:hypothetical protein